MDFLIKETIEEYHAQRKDHLSSHQLADFRRCPDLYNQKRQGLIVDKDRPAYIIGRAAHTMILEGWEVYDNTYAKGGPINKATGHPYGTATKKFQEWEAEQGRPVLTNAQDELIQNLRKGVEKHKRSTDLLSKGQPEGVVRIQYQGIKCQIRMDWFRTDEGIVDLKTCDDLTFFEHDARRYGYIHQMAFYRAVLAERTCTPTNMYLPKVHIIAVEKKEPFRCGAWKLGDEVLGIAQKENEEAIERLKHCEATNTWPTGYEEVRDFSFA